MNTLTMGDAEAIRKEVSSIKSVSPNVDGTVIVVSETIIGRHVTVVSPLNIWRSGDGIWRKVLFSRTETYCIAPTFA